MQFEPVYDFLIQKLELELPKHLSYHNAAHTIDVVQAVDYLGKSEGVSPYELQLLAAAALFHDSGFLISPENHEERSCVLAREYLPHYGYSAEDIEQICLLIMATKLTHTPVNKLESIICDADLYYLGTERFQERSEDLYREFKALGIVKNWQDWNLKQNNFLKTHRFYTHTAVNEYSFIKMQNFQELKTRQKEASWSSKYHQTKTQVHDGILIVLGVLSTGFALKGFLVPNMFFDGGITGISLLLHELYHTNLAYTIVLANLPLIIVSYFTVSKRFALRTLLCVSLLGICLLAFPYPTITSDKLLISIFGGFFLGLGIGMTMRAGCALDGVEVLALYTLRRTSFTITEIIMAINVMIFGFAALRFGLETALYSVLTYFTASRTMDYVIEGIEAYTGVTIISAKSEIIKSRLVNEMGRSITVYKGERGFLPGSYKVSSQVDIIFTVATRLELRRLKNLVNEIDPNAFVFASTIKEASGGILKRRHVH
ncbi:Uncharacterized membrane-anchored protein YitT, contains DUF161 and DUF2179 domains [Cnuella takakiae]|uniref:Uncharacterized membrane-anchored protein YitT, contains DUF161 and DUF2179 domains n=1 Tax=Cnuella takakiae TaxID=1302690 RepID=A0A1M5BSB3_9BACT|nr:YitT family protein [Cnuella takakiae]SHF45345.1 Uncharacterized membrane-anchored protein YitT, contains DUF161 and DUF2179 domains [Cnuella takakiae]